MPPIRVSLLVGHHTLLTRTMVRRPPQGSGSRVRCPVGRTMPWDTTEGSLTLPHWAFLPEERAPPQNLMIAVTLIIDSRNQVRILSIHLEGYCLFHDYFNLDFPNLKELFWGDLYVENSSSHGSTLADRSKRQLRNLRHHLRRPSVR